MSEPKRYEHMSDGMGRWFINPRTGKLAPYGEYVMSSDYARLEAEVERLKEALNKMTKTPDGVYGVDVKVNFWTMGGSRLPSSYQTFWTNEPKEDKPSV